MVDTNPSKSAPLGGAHRTLTIDQLGGGGIGWKAAMGFGGFPDHPVQAFDGVGGVDDLPVSMVRNPRRLSLE